MMTEKEYRDHPAINFSSLSWLANSPQLYYRNKYNPVEEEDKAYFAVGGALDALLTQGFAEFKANYHVMQHNRPTGKLGTFIEKYAFHLSKGVPEPIAFDAAYADAEYGISKDTVRKKLDADPYCKEKLLYEGKKRILTKEEAELILNMAETIPKYERAYKWLTPKDGIEVHKQFPIIFQAAGRECKALLDILWINHNTKTVCPVDLKTTGGQVQDFKEKFVKLRYYLQAALYTEAVKQWILQERIRREDPNFLLGYKVENFRFLVLEKRINTVPVVYQCTDSDIRSGTYGGMIGKRYVKGFYELVNDLTWHQKTGKWNAPRDIYEGNGEIMLDVFNSDGENVAEDDDNSTEKVPVF